MVSKATGTWKDAEGCGGMREGCARDARGMWRGVELEGGYGAVWELGARTRLSSPRNRARPMTIDSVGWLGDR